MNLADKVAKGIDKIVLLATKKAIDCQEHVLLTLQAAPHMDLGRLRTRREYSKKTAAQGRLFDQAIKYHHSMHAWEKIVKKQTKNFQSFSFVEEGRLAELHYGGNEVMADR